MPHEEQTLVVDRMLRFLPHVRGEITLESIPADFLDRLQQRVRDGFLNGMDRSRANYSSRPSGTEGVEIVAQDRSTASNVGLNAVVIHRKDAHHLSFEIGFAQWTRGAFLLCGAILAAILLCGAILAAMGVGGTIHNLATASPSARDPGQWIFWLLGALSYVAWPFILTELHKKPVARCLERIVRETLRASDA